MAESKETVLTFEHIPSFIRKHMESKSLENSLQIDNECLKEETLSSLLLQCERKSIEAALSKNCGNVTLAAQQLGIARQNLHYRLRKLGLCSEEFKN